MAQAVLGEVGQLLRRRSGARVVVLERDLRREPAAPGLLEVHLEDVDVRQPRVALDPQPPPALAADDERAGRAVRVEQDRAVAVGLDVGQRRLPDLVVGDRHADEGVGVQRELDVRGRDRVHEPGLLLDPGVLVDVGELDDGAVVGLGADAGQVDVRETGEQLLDRLLVLAADVHDRQDPVVVVEQRRKRRDGVERAAVLLEDLAAVRDDPIPRDGSEHCDATTARHDCPPTF